MSGSDDQVQRAAAYAGRAPAWIPAAVWHEMVADGAAAIALAQSVPNNGTPEEYAAAAIRAALPLIHGRAWKRVADELAERLSHHDFCDNDHRQLDPDCPFCRDRAAYQEYLRVADRKGR